MSNLDQAIERLQSFRARHAAGQSIDSGLTADDIDTILEQLRRPTDLEPGGSLGADDLGNLA
ncbi:hypothetical protein [Sphingomonas carotinifaciens]|uniref:Uncharacterized protein n=1 Tax=Sphingomonas carotinifaciens TaxID=1166323 RepID=A0A1G7QXC3_9SPHN|nr:hypothetical protein [Sphingomonas carotinifaciens]MBB4087888.1 hypothetical protein [Sphingomonas carotinifaciens]MWC42368.1 hypothetical protein [Sphingomonas carotinifaciens]SDG02539.1 hypothetical protein SAMN05216557_10961 [Sphingomonas carotinifaciens]